MKKDELSLIKKAQEDDRESINALLSEYAPLALMQSRIMSPGAAQGADIDDFTQFGLMAILRAIRTFDPDGGANFKTYASRCIHNTLLDHLRKKYPDVVQFSALVDDIQNPDEDPEVKVLAAESAKELVEEIKATLSPIELEVLKLFLDEHSYDEIAVELGVERKKVDNMIYSLRKKIKRLLEK